MKQALLPPYISGNLMEVLTCVVRLLLAAGYGSGLGISGEPSDVAAFTAKYPADRWSAPRADQLLHSLDAELKVPERDIVLALRIGVNPASVYKVSPILFEVIITDWPRHGDMPYPYEEFLADLYSQLILLG